MRNIIREEEEIQGGELRRVFPRLLKQTAVQRIKSKLLKQLLKQFLVQLDDGWPESVEEQSLLLLVWRHHITKQYIKDVLYAVETRSIKTI